MAKTRAPAARDAEPLVCRHASAYTTLTNGVLVVKLRGVLTDDSYGQLTGYIAHQYQRQARAVVVDFRGAVLACASWQIGDQGLGAFGRPTVFVAEGQAHDAARLVALRSATRGLSRCVTTSIEVAEQWALGMATEGGACHA